MRFDARHDSQIRQSLQGGRTSLFGSALMTACIALKGAALATGRICRVACRHNPRARYWRQ
jgi:hypothetical protein